MKKKLLIILLLSVFTQAAFAIANGIDLKPHEYPSVVLIENKKTRQVGTGVVIGRGLVLTAAHVVFHSASDYVVNKKIKVLSITKPGQISSQLRDFDLALVRIQDNSLPIMPIFKGTLPRGPISVEIVGFGLKYDRRGILDESITKRMGKSILEDTRTGNLYWSLKNNSEVYDSKLPAWALEGDSGGPMIWQEQLIGIAKESYFYSNYINLGHPAAQMILKRAH